MILLITSLTVAQDRDNNLDKFFIGINYGINLNNGYALSEDFNNNIALDLKYAAYQNKLIKLQTGMNFTYLMNNEYFFKDNLLILNPNIGVELNAFQSNFKPFINLGYMFFKDEINFKQLNVYNPTDPRFQTSNNINYFGLTINPGLRYYATDLLSLEINYKFLNLKSDNENSQGNNVNTFNLGLGINF